MADLVMASVVASWSTPEAIEAVAAAFENGSLPRSHWTHQAHLLVALVSLRRWGHDQALVHLRQRIRAYNEATGTPNSDGSGYHETLTRWFLRAVAAHQASHQELPLLESLEQLLSSPLADPAWPLRAYSPERLWSADARHGWLEPDRQPRAVLASAVPPRQRASSYPAPFAARLAGREKRVLGDLFGLSRFGVNQTLLPPGACTALRHAHSLQDEFVYVLQGHPTLISDEGELELAPGMAAGFAAGRGNAHHLVNRGAETVILLEIGDRTPGDQVDYPDDDLQARELDDGWRFSRKDGTPW
ncbi:cupin domain-containing protein [Synechococcus sp. BA-124 BA4]|jgi:uncharacterized cupin superfamily protein|uniref:cupin domain-containing protein n=1 Tax=unclassified Synechococcus TaxID=2626047 RepID=UPI00272D77BF|nr:MULTISPECIES: cupin domain-containing protein [unclassified Synechococcus]MEA5399684.1 cupin domain-containing protein [Synechococcus sp. BA-124 BA4]CAK6696442.1 hypothetical protein BBFGKLBO_02051 [Synechococcus sp. CBW1107]